jgi:hypothetical protein
LLKFVSYSSDDTNVGDASKLIEFVKDLIVTPPTGCEQTELERNFPPTVKRNLSKVFDGVAKEKSPISLSIN